MKNLRLRWLFFWSRRSRVRIWLTVILMLFTLLAIGWFALPADWQRQMQSGISLAARWVGSLDTRTVLAGLIGLCVVEGLLTLLVPSYRKHGYLATSPSYIPPVSVYLDAENQLSEAIIRPFMDYLVKFLDGGRADFLFFLDAAQEAPKEKYKTLNRVGFRLIDVPHNPTGKKVMSEAVDREIAMHAFERALLGPEHQEFIIVSGDGDYVPLIYRLVALGHRVQIWAQQPSSAYDVVANYLGVNVINLADVLSESSSDSSHGTRDEIPASAPVIANRRRRSRRKNSQQAVFVPQGHPTIPTSLAHPGEGKLYYAIAETLAAHEWSLASSESDEERNALFRSALGNALRPRLNGVGYGIGSWTDYWLDHLTTLDVFVHDDGKAFPLRGKMSEEDAARAMFVAAQVGVEAVRAVAATDTDGIIHMSEVAAAIVATPFDSNERAAPLLDLVKHTTGTKQWAHMRYFVRSARALGLLKFQEDPKKFDEIKNPSLPDPDAMTTPAQQGATASEISTAGGPASAAEEPTAQVEELATD